VSDPESGSNAAPQPDGTLTIAVRPPGQPNAPWAGYTGWTRQRITSGIEDCPSDFELEATDKVPDGATAVDIQPGYECFIVIGTQRVLTGYVDRVAFELTPTAHVVRITGRSKCADIVDCSAEFSTFQLNNTNPLSLAQVLVKDFGITASAAGDIGNTQIPQFDVILTETPYEIIERVARYAALLAYDDVNGNLVLSRAGQTEMASGFSQGVNVQEAYGLFTMDERYSSVEATILTTDTLYTDPGSPNDSSAIALDAIQGALATDKGVLRNRPLILIAEQGDINYQVAQQRCLWEVNRRIGRSQAVRVIADSWFDMSGNLWAKNSLAPINLPAMRISNAKWLIGSVTFTRDEDGTRADVTLMPAAAFLPEPIILLPYASDVNQALYPNGGAAASDGTDDPNNAGTSPLLGFTPGGAQ
jgi:prophage tail gpP-like protein